MRRVYSHSSTGEPGLSISRPKSKNESASFAAIRNGCSLVTGASSCDSHVFSLWSVIWTSSSAFPCAPSVLRRDWRLRANASARPRHDMPIGSSDVIPHGLSGPPPDADGSPGVLMEARQFRSSINNPIRIAVTVMMVLCTQAPNRWPKTDTVVVVSVAGVAAGSSPLAGFRWINERVLAEMNSGSGLNSLSSLNLYLRTFFHQLGTTAAHRNTVRVITSIIASTPHRRTFGNNNNK